LNENALGSMTIRAAEKKDGPVLINEDVDIPESDANTAQVEDKPSLGADEDIDPDAFFSCNECDTFISDCKSQRAYYYIYCIDVDLCQACFGRRIQRGRGELAPAGRTVCPVDHKHIEAPAAGWKGVKDGVMTIEDQMIVFRDWLKGLEGREVAKSLGGLLGNGAGLITGVFR
jgi:ferredoxin